ncbi:LysR family transcriptional regulator [Accumulibacter sp.]|uniref:LysR family transcriptional regulator n=1 Tax=Accumulibacter sp. TaxID=2053492 RepID=UPI001A63D6A1|nr:LysR family transcriptional regulator [Accumulibacter sp.]
MAYLHISQPVLSRSIAGLDQSLGGQLFDRTPAGVQPTIRGQTVIERGHDILQKERAAMPSWGSRRLRCQGQRHAPGTSP